MDQTTAKLVPAATSSTPVSPSFPLALAGERGVVWALWLTYGAFYFCRTNISAAVPGLKSSLADGGLALSGDQVGWILASLKIAYGLGQLVNGQLSERVSPRVMLAIGMFGSAALNVLFGFGTGFFFLLFVWATNGFCQSLGWTPTVRITANWVPIMRRGHAIGIIGTGYQITLGLTYVIAGQSAELLGWRGAVWVPAALLTLCGVFMIFCLREAPQHLAATSLETSTVSRLDAARASLAKILYWTLYNPTLWLLGLSLGLLNACRYGFLDWGITHLMETRDVGVGKAGLQFFVIAIGATAGSYLAGWATDRFFGSRRAPVVCILMAVLGCLSLVYDSAAHQSTTGTMLLLVVIGFCIYGPQVLLVGTAPADLAHRGTSAAAAGFVNFMGYMGAATGDVVTGYYSSPAHGGWQLAIYIWAGWAFAGSIIMAILWNTTARKVGLLSGTIPKLGAVALIALAGAAIALGELPAALQLATWAAAACLLGTFFSRWAAAPALLVAPGGLLTVFASYVRQHDGVSWEQSTAMVAYGLTLIAVIMILVEQKGEGCESS
jgi:sugar phosphate permease